MIARLRLILRRSTHNIRSMWTQVVSIARDPVKIWDLAFKIIFKLDSYLFILPITLSTNQDGMRVLTIPTKPSRLVMPYALNVAIAIRIFYLVSITFDDHFRWLVDGQFTADASIFVLLVFIGSEVQALHFTFLEHREDFVFLRNSVLKLNAGFSGNYVFTVL